MKRKELNSVEELMKQKLGGMEQTPRPELWNNIKVGINPKAPVGFDSLFRMISSGYGLQIGIIVFLSLSIGGTYLLVKNYISEPTDVVELQDPTLSVPEDALEKIIPSEEITNEKISKKAEALIDTQRLVRVLVLDSPKNGNIRFDLLSKSFTYTPREDFFGLDSFTFAKVYNNNVQEKSATVIVKVEPEVTVEANFAYENVGDLQLRLFNRSKIISNDPKINKADFIRWEIGDGRSSLASSPMFKFEQEGMQRVCITVGLDSIVREHCLEIMVTRDPNNNSDNINAKGKSNQPVQIDIEEKSQKPKREIILPLEGILNSFLSNTSTFSLSRADKVYLGVDSTSEEESSFNQQPVKKKESLEETSSTIAPNLEPYKNLGLFDLERFSDLHVSYFFAPGISYRKLRGNQDYVDLRNASESSRLAFLSGIRTDVTYNDKWVIRLALAYSRRGENSTYFVRTQQGNDTTITVYNNDKNEYNYFSVMNSFAYALDVEDFQFLAGLGFSNDYLLSADATVLSPSKKDLSYIGSTQTNPYNFSYHLFIEAVAPLSRTVSVFVSPTYIRSLSKTYKEDTFGKQRNYQLLVSFGIQADF